MYKELYKGYRYKRTESGLEGRRLFIEDDNGTFSDVPDIGDLFVKKDGTIIPNLFVREIEETHYDNQTNTILAYEVIYHSRPTDLLNLNIGGSSADKDLPRRMSIGGEFKVIKKPEGVENPIKWRDNDEAVDQDLFKRLARGTVTITKITTNYDGMRQTAIDTVGKVNDSTFEGESAGVWLYVGAEVKEFFNADGQRSWQFDHTFSFRRVTFDSGANNDGWNFLYRESTGEWVRIKNTADSDADIYESANFRSLFT